MNRLRIAQEISDKVAGRTWRVWERPVGPDEDRIRHTGTWYEPHHWRAVFRHLFANEEEALDRLLAYIGGGNVEKVDGEYRKYGMRYIVEEEKD